MKTELIALKELREELTILIERKNRLEDEFKGRHQRLYDEIEVTARAVEACEDAIRRLGLEEYNRTKEKNLFGGVQVKIFTVISYDKLKAFKWALEHKLALKLDIKVFEDLAKKTPIDFVEVKQEPRVQIPSKIEVKA